MQANRVRDRDRHGNRQRSSRRHFFVRDISAIAKENCIKERTQGKETVPVNASDKAKKSEVNYIYTHIILFPPFSIASDRELRYVQPLALSSLGICSYGEVCVGTQKANTA